MWVTLVVLATVLLVGVVGYSSRRRFPVLQFYAKGKESGFTLRETRLLHRVAVERELEDPTSLFWSRSELDRSIRGIIEHQHAEGVDTSEQSIRFVSKLFGFRNRVEFNLPKYRRGLQSTRSIAVGQRLKLTYPGGGLYSTKVVENFRRHLAVEYPRGRTMGPVATWRGQTVNVYFWRQDDAGYYFDSRVIGDYFDRRDPVLHLSHSEQLARAQKRSAVRRKVGGPGTLLPLRSLEGADEEPPRGGGYRCRVIDISENGAALLVGGRTATGFALKLYVRLVGYDIVLCGTVRHSRYRENTNRSVLHVEAIQPSAKMRNRILSYVYGIFDEGTDEATNFEKQEPDDEYSEIAPENNS